MIQMFKQSASLPFRNFLGLKINSSGTKINNWSICNVAVVRVDLRKKNTHQIFPSTFYLVLIVSSCVI